MRRALVGLASTALLLLGGCGSGTIESQLKPTRVVVFGDAFSDAGQTGAKYTVNDGSLNWAQFVAANYGLTIIPVASGGTVYATGNARVLAKPDAAGDSTTPTIKEQIDTFLASNTLGINDLVIIQAGFSDVIAEVSAFRSGAQTNDQMIGKLTQAGRDMAAQAKRLVAAGSNHVVVVGAYDLSVSPWAATISQQNLLHTASSTFNESLLVAIVDQGHDMLYVDAALLFNNMHSSPSSYSFTNIISPVCNSLDAGPGIGIGAQQVNSKLCTTSTLVDANYTAYLFADAVYPTPAGHARMGDYAYSKIHSRW